MIQVHIDELKGELSRLNSNASEFEEYSSFFISNTKGLLEGMNSDFVDKIESSLNNMTDSKAPNLLEKIKQYTEKCEKLIQDWEKVDNEISNVISTEDKE